MYFYYILVFLVATSIYYNSLSGDFVHDDIVAIVRNPDVNLAKSVKNGLSSFSNNGENWDRWWSLWKNDYWGMPMSSPLSHKSYRPLTVLTFRLNYYLCNNSLCPEVFHGTNIFIHGLVSTLTLDLCRSVLKMRLRTAVFTSLIFSLHPIHTEAVAGITGRADALACLLMLISFLLYHKVLSLSSPEKLSSFKKRIDCQDQPEMRESEKCTCKSTLVQKSFISFTTGNQTTTNAEFHSNFLDLNDNEYQKSTMATPSSSLFSLSKANALLVASGLVGCASMFAKETGITVLGINLLYDLYLHLYLFIPSQKGVNNEANQAGENCLQSSSMQFDSHKYNLRHYRHRKYFLKRIFFVIILIFLSLSIRFALMNGEFPKFGRPDNPASYSNSTLTRLLTYAYLPVFNFILLIHPRTLSYDWQMGSIPLVETIWDSRNFATFAFYVTLFLLVQQGIISKKYKKKNTVLAVAVLFIVIPYLPASNLLFSVGFVVAERVLYIPSLGICILIAHGLESLYKAINTELNKKYQLQVFCKLCVGVSVCSLLVSFGLRTWQRNAVWQSRLTLFTSGIQDVPHNAKMHYNYANLQKDNGQSTKAIEHYAMAIKLWPEYPSAHNNLGTLLMGNPAAAEHHFLQAIKTGNQAHGGAHFNLGVLYVQKDKHLEAASHFKKSIIIDPSHEQAMEYLSYCYSMIHTKNEEKSRNKIDALRNSTEKSSNSTVVNTIDPSVNKSESIVDSDVISQNNQFRIQQNITTSSTSKTSSNDCIPHLSAVTQEKPLEQLNILQGTKEFTNNFLNDYVK